MTTSSSTSTPPTQGTAAFFLATFGISWVLQLPAALAARGALPGPVERFMPLVALGALGPTFAALLVSRLEPGGVRALFRPMGIWRVGARWYLAALVMPGALLFVGMAVHSLFGGAARPWLYPPADPARVAAMFLFPVAEEVGWRGFALPRLQARHGALAASAILGVLWALWHIPMFLAAGIPVRLFPLLFLLFLPGSVFFTWLYNRTRGSLLLAVLAHVGVHLNNSHIPLPADVTPAMIHTATYTILAVVLLLADRSAFPGRQGGDELKKSSSAP